MLFIYHSFCMSVVLQSVTILWLKVHKVKNKVDGSGLPHYNGRSRFQTHRMRLLRVVALMSPVSCFLAKSCRPSPTLWLSPTYACYLFLTSMGRVLGVWGFSAWTRPSQNIHNNLSILRSPPACICKVPIPCNSILRCLGDISHRLWDICIPQTLNVEKNTGHSSPIAGKDVSLRYPT